MKSIINEEKIVSELPFPKLMVSTLNGVVVLMCGGIAEERLCGVVVSQPVDVKYKMVGQYGNTWLSENFIDFHGSVTLSN